MAASFGLRRAHSAPPVDPELASLTAAVRAINRADEIDSITIICTIATQLVDVHATRTAVQRAGRLNQNIKLEGNVVHDVALAAACAAFVMTVPLFGEEKGDAMRPFLVLAEHEVAAVCTAALARFNYVALNARDRINGSLPFNELVIVAATGGMPVPWSPRQFIQIGRLSNHALMEYSTKQHQQQQR